MAMIKTLGSIRGFDVNYWRIVRLIVDRNGDLSEATLSGFKDKQDANDFPLQPLQVKTVQIPVFLRSIAEAYTWLSTNPNSEFAGSESDEVPPEVPNENVIVERGGDDGSDAIIRPVA